MIGEHRALSLEEQRERFGQQCRDAQALERLEPEQRDTKTIAGKFAEALGHIEDAIARLEAVDKRYDQFYPDDGHSIPEYPERYFWMETYEAIDALREMLQGLKDVEKHMPKEKEETR